VIASISTIVSTLHTSARLAETEMENVAAYMEERKLPKDLATRIRKYYKFFLSQKTALNEAKILQGLSPQLREEVAAFLMADIVQLHPYFLFPLLEQA
jgi:hypothetical protein